MEVSDERQERNPVQGRVRELISISILVSIYEYKRIEYSWIRWNKYSIFGNIQEYSRHWWMFHTVQFYTILLDTYTIRCDTIL